MTNGNKEDDNGTTTPRGQWRLVGALALAVAIWGGLLALGAYLEPGADQPQRDPRKFWLVLGCVAGFLALWGGALWVRSRTKRRG